MEHFERWAHASGQHGLCILEASCFLILSKAARFKLLHVWQAMLQDVPTTVKHFDENVTRPHYVGLVCNIIL